MSLEEQIQLLRDAKSKRKAIASELSDAMRSLYLPREQQMYFAAYQQVITASLINNLVRNENSFAVSNIKAGAEIDSEAERLAAVTFCSVLTLQDEQVQSRWYKAVPALTEKTES